MFGPKFFLQFLVIVGTACAAGAETTYVNPVVKDGADPAVLVDASGTYHLYVTRWYQTAHYSSPNGASDWSEIQVAYQGDKNNPGWAPTLRKADGRWYLYNVGAVAVADSPAGPFERLSDDFGFDPMYFEDPADGRHWLYQGGSHAGLVISEMTSPITLAPDTGLYFLPPTGWGRTWEGVFVDVINDQYYLLLSSFGANSANYRLHYAVGDSPRGPFRLTSIHDGDAFLRRSDHEEIFGPGHHATVRDAHGTIWVYYQQHNDRGGNYNRGVAVDPLWVDASGALHIRPTRGRPLPGPGTEPQIIWPRRKGHSKIEAESYNGSRFVTLSNGGSGTIVREFRHRALLAYRNIDAGDGANLLRVRVANGNETPSSISLHLGGIDEPSVGTVTIPPTGGWDQWVTLEARLASGISGAHDLILQGRGSEPFADALHLDWWSLTQSDPGEGGNLAPKAENDHASVPVDGKVVIDLLANDRDPESTPLRLRGIGNASTAKQSESAAASNLKRLGNGKVRYTPPEGFWGTDRFFYSVADDAGAIAHGIVTLKVEPTEMVRLIDGEALIEAENFLSQESYKDALNACWTRADSIDGYSGSGYVTTPDQGTSEWIAERAGNPRSAQLDYALELPTGFYTLWARVFAPSEESDVASLSLSTSSIVDVRPDINQAWLIQPDTTGEWIWVKSDNPVSVNGGLFRLALRRGEDGFAVDAFRIVKE